MTSFLEETWQAIEPSLYIILGDENNSSLDSKMYSETYTKVYNFCTTSTTRRPPTVQEHNSTGLVKLVGGELYDKVRQFLHDYLMALNQKEGETFLQFYIRAWQRFQVGAKRLNDILDYLNRYWVSKERAGGQRGVYDIFSLSLLSWRDYKFKPNLNELMSELLEQIRLQRIGSTDYIKNIYIAIQSFVSLGFEINDLKKTNLSVYITDFEKPFLTETYNFYSNESDNYIKNNGVVNYVIRSQQRIDEEIKRLEDLNDHTRRPLNDALNAVLVKNHQEIIRAELDTLLDQERYEDVKKIYCLLKRVNATIPPLLERFQKYIEKQGSDSVLQIQTQMKAAAISLNSTAESDGKRKRPTDPIDSKLYIKSLLNVYNKYKQVVLIAFNDSEAFKKALDSACNYFINSNVIATPTPRSKSKTAQLLAKYVDELLTKKSSDMSIDDVMVIFHFIEDKEGFETFYRRMLYRRLMSGTMTPEDEENESAIIDKLKTAASNDYTNKITKMFNDIRISSELGDYYRSEISKLANSTSLINNLDPKILDQTAWDNVLKETNDSFILPHEFIDTQEKFSEIYQQKHNGRQLQWKWSRSKVEVKANISKPGKPPYQITMTMYQYAIFSAFQESEIQTTQQLLALTALPEEIFRNNVIPMIKHKLLSQEPSGDKNMLKPFTTFKLNTAYSSKKLKINISNVKMMDSKTEEREANEEIEMQKHEVLRAAIVRIMKARKNMKHEQLSTEVFQIVERFKPNVSQVKKAIEVLIEEQYLSRDADGNGYEYIS